MKPHLLMDIDGVLCPFGHGFDPNGFIMYEIMDGVKKHKVFASEDNKARLTLLQKHFRISWASMWEHLANQNSKELFGIEEELPVIKFAYNLDNFHKLAEGEPDAHFRLDGWSFSEDVTTLKYPYLYQWAKHGQPFVWVDDDIGADVRAWVESRNTPALLIQTESQIGLTDNHVEEMILFAESI